MPDELLPEWLNLILDDFESSLSLPIMLIIIICTIQFILNHLFGIGYVIYRNIKGRRKSKEVRTRKDEKVSLMNKLKTMITSFRPKKPCSCNKT